MIVYFHLRSTWAVEIAGYDEFGIWWKASPRKMTLG